MSFNKLILNLYQIIEYLLIKSIFFKNVKKVKKSFHNAAKNWFME